MEHKTYLKTNASDLISDEVKKSSIYNKETKLYESGDIIGCGLTKREYFAAAALAGILSSPDKWEEVKVASHVADLAVITADHLINSLNKEKHE